MKMTSITFTLLILLLMAAAACRRPSGPPPMMIPEVAVVTIQPERVEMVAELPGRTTAFLVAEVRPQVSGILQQRLFDEGSMVSQGQVLYRIDPAMYEATLQSARASLARAEAAANAARQRAGRVRELVAEQAISQQDFDDAEAAAKSAEAEILFWQAAVEQALIHISYTTITAPVTGRIGKSSVTAGAMVIAYQPLPLAVIQQTDPMYVDVPQSSIHLLRARQQREEGRWKNDGDAPRTVTLVMPDGRMYPEPGQLQFTDITVNPATGTLDLRALFPNPGGVLMPGMFVRALVTEGIRDDALLVPVQGVQRDVRGDAYALLVTAENTVKAQSLEVDRVISNRWLVVRGVSAGDRIIVEGSQRVRPGGAVRAVAYQPGAPVASTTLSSGP